MIKVGCCGWGYLRIKDFFGEEEANKFKSVLQAYASLFPSAEINSTFYRIPKLTTAEKWRKEADEINKNFEFTVKCSQLVTHTIKFTKGSVKFFNIMKDICKKLDSKILLFQSPAGFKATDENIGRMESFFENIDRENLILTWECRGNWLKNPKLVRKICKKFELVHCVDPFRNEPLYFGKKKIAYFRLHGFGLISMYHYNFSMNELKELKEKIDKLKKLKEIFVFFNNSNMYQNAVQFMKLLKK
jgi:uncharacterized protein YecE (DUF72 family)